MLSDKLRDGANSKGFKALLTLIVISFVLTGVGGYLIPRIDTDPVKVGDLKVSNGEWTEQYNRRAQQLHQLGPQAGELLENPEYVSRLKMQVLESLVDNLAFNSAVWDMNVRIGDEQVREVIRNNPAFRKDGKFNNDLYLATLRNMGMNPEYFGEQIRISLMAQSISEPVMSVSTVPMPYEIKTLSELLAQRRTVNLYTVDDQKIAEGITVSEDEAKKYYDEHNATFMAPANARFTYLLLSLDALKDQIGVTDADLENFYNMYNTDFTVDEQRQVSHILIRKSSENAADKIAAVEKELASGTDFAAVARKHSEDGATAEKGGDMGAVSKGELSSNMDQVIFSMQKEGEISKRIDDDFGTHFIRLDKIIAPHTPALSEIRDQVKQAYLNNKARELYNKSVTTMSDLSFENPDSLDVTAETLKLQIKDSGLLALGDASAVWPLNTDAVQKLAFDEDVYTSGVNSQVISIDDEHSIVINVSEHHDAALRDFAEVREQALELVRQDKIAEASTSILTEFGKALESDPKAAPPENVQERKDVLVSASQSGVSQEFSRAIMALPKSAAASRIIADNDGRRTMAVLQKVEQGSEDEIRGIAQFLNAQLAQIMGESTRNAMYRRARELNTIEYNQDAIDLVTRQNNEDL